MENVSYLISSSANDEEIAFNMTAINPSLGAGVLMGHLLLGLASYTWAFWSQRSRLESFKQSIISIFLCQQHTLRGVQIIHNMLLFLPLIDILSSITAIVLAAELTASICSSGLTCFYAFLAWSTWRCLGVVSHLLNALVCLLFLCHPQMEAKLRRVCILVFLLTFVCVPCYALYAFISFLELISQVSIYAFTAITAGLTLAIIAKYIVSTASPSADTLKKQIVLVATLTFFIVITPTFILQCLMFSAAKHEDSTDYLTIYVNVLLCTNFQIVMDGLLCYFILKLPSEEEEQRQEQHESFENPNYAISENVASERADV